jgi:hypothetical protein
VGTKSNAIKCFTEDCDLVACKYLTVENRKLILEKCTEDPEVRFELYSTSHLVA